MAKYCYCCKGNVDHCFCSFHSDGCGKCMKHDVKVVDEVTTLANGDVLTRKVKKHVCA